MVKKGAMGSIRERRKGTGMAQDGAKEEENDYLKWGKRKKK